MRVLIIDNGSSYLNNLTGLFSQHDCTVTSIEGLAKKQIEPGTLVVLSGGHTLPVLWHNKYYAKELEIITSYDGPIFGICLGFELIAHAYYNHLSLLPRRAHLKRIVTINSEGRRYFSIPQFTAFESHRFALRKSKHPIISLGTTKNGIEIIRHATKPIFAVQFHPEKLPSRQLNTIFNEILSALTPIKVD